MSTAQTAQSNTSGACQPPSYDTVVLPTLVDSAVEGVPVINTPAVGGNLHTSALGPVTGCKHCDQRDSPLSLTVQFDLSDFLNCGVKNVAVRPARMSVPGFGLFVVGATSMLATPVGNDLSLGEDDPELAAMLEPPLGMVSSSEGITAIIFSGKVTFSLIFCRFHLISTAMTSLSFGFILLSATRILLTIQFQFIGLNPHVATPAYLPPGVSAAKVAFTPFGSKVSYWIYTYARLSVVMYPNKYAFEGLAGYALDPLSSVLDPNLAATHVGTPTTFLDNDVGMGDPRIIYAALIQRDLESLKARISNFQTGNFSQRYVHNQLEVLGLSSFDLSTFSYDRDEKSCDQYKKDKQLTIDYIARCLETYTGYRNFAIMKFYFKLLVDYEQQKMIYIRIMNARNLPIDSSWKPLPFQPDNVAGHLEVALREAKNVPVDATRAQRSAVLRNLQGAQKKKIKAMAKSNKTRRLTAQAKLSKTDRKVRISEDQEDEEAIDPVAARAARVEVS